MTLRPDPQAEGPQSGTPRPDIANAARVVVKVGSSSLTTPDGEIDDDAITALAQALAERRRGAGTDPAGEAQVVLVSSGAIASGLVPLGLSRRPSDLATQQAAASVGQGLLIARYTAAFAAYGIRTGQVLLSADDLMRRTHYRNAQRTLDRLLELGVLPVVNENDTVATDEIRFGDNDRLAALVAHVTRAGALILLSDVDGLYDGDPRRRGRRPADRRSPHQGRPGRHPPGPRPPRRPGGQPDQAANSRLTKRPGRRTWHRWHGDQGRGRHDRDLSGHPDRRGQRRRRRRRPGRRGGRHLLRGPRPPDLHQAAVAGPRRGGPRQPAPGPGRGGSRGHPPGQPPPGGHHRGRRRLRGRRPGGPARRERPDRRARPGELRRRRDPQPDGPLHQMAGEPPRPGIRTRSSPPRRPGHPLNGPERNGACGPPAPSNRGSRATSPDNQTKTSCRRCFRRRRRGWSSGRTDRCPPGPCSPPRRGPSR